MQNTISPYGGSAGAQEGPCEKPVREKPKPLSWFLSDPMYNNSICEELGIETDEKFDGGISSAD